MNVFNLLLILSVKSFPKTAQYSNRPIISRLLEISFTFVDWFYDSYRPAFWYNSSVKDNIKQFSVNRGHCG